MKSRISCFEKTVFKKDLTRFAPLWAIYLIGGVMVMMSVLLDLSHGAAAEGLGYTVGAFSVINLIYACVVAQLLFGDLFNSRMCNAIHAMPLSRSQLFGSHVAAGLCYSLVPHIIGALLMTASLGEFWFVAFIWLLGMVLEYLFFFGVAVFSCFCTGNRFAMVAVYGIINFFSLIVYWFVSTIYSPMMEGVVIDNSIFLTLCPVVSLCGREGWIIMDGYYDYYSYYGDHINYGDYRYTYEGLGDGWGYLSATAVIGVVLLALAWLMYRRRQLECAGDFIAVKPLGPVFTVVFTLCVGAVFALFGELLADNYVLFLIIGMILGYFVAQMLLQRTVKVFQLRAFGKLAILAAAMIASLLLVRADLFGVVGYVPDAQKVVSVTVSTSSRFPEYSDTTVELDKAKDIAAITDIHEYILERGSSWGDANYTTSLAFRYELENGRTVTRYYQDVPMTTGIRQQLKGMYSTVEALTGFDTWEEFAENTSFLEIEGQTYTPEQVPGLMDALEADLEAGNLAQVWFLHSGKGSEYYVGIQTAPSENGGGDYYYYHLEIYPEARNTVAWLNDFLKELEQQKADEALG